MTKNEVFCSILGSKNIDSNFININKVSMNSKEIQENDLFVAIRGGNDYINEALEKRAYAVYDDINAKIDERYTDRAFYVNDSVLFLQEFAKKWREVLDIKVIGITGSNGKTTVKDITYQLLSAKYKGKKTEGNYNNHIGLPFTLLRLEKDDEFIILEMGMSGFGEIDLLGKISNPDISIITNIGESHLEFLHTKKNVFKAKTEIVPYTKEVLIINGDDDYLKDVESNRLKIVKALKESERKFGGNDDKTEKDSEDKQYQQENMSKGQESKSELGRGQGEQFQKENKNFYFYYGDVRFDEKGTHFSLKYNEKENSENMFKNMNNINSINGNDKNNTDINIDNMNKNRNENGEIERNFNTNLLGEHNILNLTMGIAVAKQFDIDDKTIEETVKNINLTNMRFQIIEKENTVYINDAYNASPASMRKSLETFSKIYNDRIKIVVLGDMLELGEKELELHSELSETIEQCKLDKIYLFGERMKSLYSKLKGNFEKENEKGNKKENFEKKEVFHFSDKNLIKEELKKVTDKKAVLIKGSRGMKLEEIID
jgi:UDP-N-acetylmuramoyl-tripeptide--D-alanyl-D-alanine ligase